MVSRTVRLAAVIGLILTACSHPDRLAAVPAQRTAEATVLNRTDLRYWPDTEQGNAAIVRDATEAYDREREERDAAGFRGPLPPAHYLAVSGGAEDGAFGAGLLVGWTEAGTRPTFKVVTGISTGALTAPFAFLGPAWDKPLTQVYTAITVQDVAQRRGLLAALFDDALADTAPLRRLISRYATPQMLRAIAAEHAKGRLLLIGTTDLDARRPVIWNIGKIAASGHPGALRLFHDILLASASVPGAFPPVMIDVEIDGQPFQEMHVDGGASSQVFFYPPSIDFGTKFKTKAARQRSLWILRNGRLDPEWAEVKRQTLGISGRAVSALIQSQGVGDLYIMYAAAKRDGIDYNLAFIPKSFAATSSKPFDQAYMRQAYAFGRQLAATYPWLKAPPNFADTP